ncbi:kmo [Symbiodinium sp. CCMP2592]|nr:kmo [Symbiodinium sp. CCMP2592]
MPNGQFSWAQAAKAWKSQPVDWRPASELLSTDAEPDEPLTTEAWDISTSSEPLGLQAVLDYVAPYWEVVYEGNESAAEHAEELYFTYLYNVTAESREAPVLQACWHGLATGANSEQPLLGDTASKAFLSVTLPRLTELCDPRFEADYSAVLVTYHDNGLFANILQLLDALLLAKPGAPVLVDWQRKGGEGHFQYGPIGFDLFEHLFSRTQRCRSWGKYSADRRLHSSSYNMNKRVSILFMNMLRGLIWSVPPKDFQALRAGYYCAMQGALTISPLISRRVREVTETWPERARVVGVHKRLGTNEVAACQLAQRNPPPEEYLEAAKALLQQTPPGVQQVLYLATDEVQTVEVFRKALPPGSQIQLCCRDGVKRSRGGVRPDGIDNEVHRSPCEAVDAEDALVDAMCLSKCTDLVCIDSNLSIFVSMLNPRIHIHAMSDAVPPGWEERANYPREPVYSSYRVAWNPGLFLSAFPSTAAEIVGQVLFDQIVHATGRFWEGWVELENGGWVRAQGGRSGCWAMECVENGMVSMRRVSRGELLVPEGERLPRRRRPDEPLPSACCRAETSAYTACTWACISLRAGPRYRRKPQV